MAKRQRQPAQGEGNSGQQQKYMLGLAGEFLVAGELFRRNISAGVTYGNAKKADVVAVRGLAAAPIEVKTTQQNRWNVGGSIPDDDQDAIWIFVHIPKQQTERPRYFVLTGSEVHTIVAELHRTYCTEYRKRHGREYKGRSVHTVPRANIEKHEDRWDKVDAALAR